jgi:hypothetical protein
MCDMNFIYFICPKNPQLAKYCEAFYNYLTYGYKTWARDRYTASTPKDKQGQSRLLMKRGSHQTEEMRASDPVFDRIYKKVITSDCYEHRYIRLTESEITASEQVIFITSSKQVQMPPNYLSNNTNAVSVWKVSNLEELTDNKYQLLESLVRRMTKPKE